MFFTTWKKANAKAVPLHRHRKRTIPLVVGKTCNDFDFQLRLVNISACSGSLFTVRGGFAAELREYHVPVTSATLNLIDATT